MDETLFWTIIGAVAAVIGVLSPIVYAIGRGVRRQFVRDLEPIRDENRRLREELDTRLRLPTFGLDAVRLTELAAQRRIEEIEQGYRKAVEQKDQQLANALAEQLREIGELRQQLDATSAARGRLETSLRNAIVPRRLQGSGNGVSLPTGEILIVKLEGKYGAVKAADQASSERGSFIRYIWWYQPDGSGVFVGPTTQTGYSETREVRGRPSPQLEVGPIRLQWSVGGDGIGWVYFGPGTSPSPGYQLGLTNEIDIARVDAAKVELLNPTKKA